MRRVRSKRAWSVDGVVAQLVERLVRNEKVRGSTPLGSTIQTFQKDDQRLSSSSAKSEWRCSGILLRQSVARVFMLEMLVWMAMLNTFPSRWTE